MKKIIVILGCLALVLTFSSSVMAKKGGVKGNNNDDACTTIQDGTLVRSDGEVIETGYDEWGYNYQAHLFNGGYCDAYRDAAWCQPYKYVELLMKWNDAWLSNKDCDEEKDGLLDRHAGFDSYIGSGAWTTNHQSETYYDDDGNIQKWNYFVKIVAAPADAIKISGENGKYWFAADGTEIGPVIWGDFAIIQQIYNDSGTGEHGVEYLSPAGPGFGKFK